MMDSRKLLIISFLFGSLCQCVLGVSVVNKNNYLIGCNELASADFGNYSLYINTDEENYSTKSTFYVFGNGPWRFELKERTVDSDQSYTIDIGGDYNILMRHPNFVQLDSSRSRAHILKPAIPNKVELELTRPGEIVLVVHNEIVLATKVPDPNPIKINVITFHPNGTDIVFYNCLGNNGNGNTLYPIYTGEAPIKPEQNSAAVLASASISVTCSIVCAITLFMKS